LCKYKNETNAYLVSVGRWQQGTMAHCTSCEDFTWLSSPYISPFSYYRGNIPSVRKGVKR